MEQKLADMKRGVKVHFKALLSLKICLPLSRWLNAGLDICFRLTGSWSRSMLGASHRKTSEVSALRSYFRC